MPRSHTTRLLERRINEAIDRLVESVVAGDCSNYERYREMIGTIRGLREAMVICDEIEGELANESSNAS